MCVCWGGGEGEEGGANKEGGVDGKGEVGSGNGSWKELFMRGEGNFF